MTSCSFVEVHEKLLRGGLGWIPPVLYSGNHRSNTFLYLWEVWPKLLQEKSGAGQYISHRAQTLLKADSPRLVTHTESFVCIADLPACRGLTGALSRGEINLWPKKNFPKDSVASSTQCLKGPMCKPRLNPAYLLPLPVGAQFFAQHPKQEHQSHQHLFLQLCAPVQCEARAALPAWMNDAQLMALGSPTRFTMLQ